VRYVLEGSVRKSGRRVRVTAQLIRADTNHHIMAERYDRDLTDLFELQDEIVTAIAGSIEPEILKFERERIAERPQHSEGPTICISAVSGIITGTLRRTTSKPRPISAARWRSTRITRKLRRHCPWRCATRPTSPGRKIRKPTMWSAMSWGSGRLRSTLDIRPPASPLLLSARGPAAPIDRGGISRGDKAESELCRRTRNPWEHAQYRGQSEEGLVLIEKGIRLSPTDPRLFMWLPPLAAAHYPAAELCQIGRGRAPLLDIEANWQQAAPYVIAGLAQLGRSTKREPRSPI